MALTPEIANSVEDQSVALIYPAKIQARVAPSLKGGPLSDSLGEKTGKPLMPGFAAGKPSKNAVHLRTCAIVCPRITLLVWRDPVVNSPEWRLPISLRWLRSIPSGKRADVGRSDP
jgi:hypothetical protein